MRVTEKEEQEKKSLVKSERRRAAPLGYTVRISKRGMNDKKRESERARECV